MKKILFLFFCVVFLCSCSKETEKHYTITEKNGVKDIHNNNPKELPVSSFKFTLKDSLLIDLNKIDEGFKFIKVNTSKNGNYYIFNGNDNKIYKFSNKGSLLSSFGGKGNGPGEVEQSFSFAVVDSLVIISCASQQKIVLYNIEGNHLRDLKKEDINSEISVGYIAFGQNLLGNDFSMFFDKDRMSKISRLNIYDKNFKILKQLGYKKQNLELSKAFDPQNDFYIFGSSSNILALAEFSKDFYRFKIYNQEGKLTHNVSRAFRKVSLTPEEKAEIAGKYSFTVTTNGKNHKLKVKVDFKNAIEGIKIDKNNQIWVKPAFTVKEENTGYDIYKNGILIARQKLPTYLSNFGFIGDKLYNYDPNKNILKLYSY